MSTITINTTIKASPKQAYQSYLNPNDNKHWQNAGGGWSTGFVTINAKPGGRFEIEYKSPDGKTSFVFGGKYLELIEDQKITYLLDDGRNVTVAFVAAEQNNTNVTIQFEPENENSSELQEQGWGQVLNNFKTFLERKVNPEFAAIEKTITLKASSEKVWDTLLKQENYQKWTSAFCAGSYYESDMQMGSKIHFLSPDKSGLSSVIKVLIPNFQISFEHLGAVKNSVEDFDSPEFEAWKGARETYTLNEKDGITTLEIYSDIAKSEFEYFAKMWDKALELIREIAEN